LPTPRFLRKDQVLKVVGLVRQELMKLLLVTRCRKLARCFA
jgi:hypothetical protein